MTYIENPKTKGSGIICCIPQKGHCPLGCEDCFYNTGRSYLEPLDENTPNMPPLSEAYWKVVRVNDGGDSSVERHFVMDCVRRYPQRFYNTSIHDYIHEFDAPVVLTVNPGSLTDEDFYMVWSWNLMFVRARVNTWNLNLIDRIVEHYTIESANKIPVVLTFMAYFRQFSPPCPHMYHSDYVFRKRTLNSYWAITTEAWRRVMKRYKNNKWVHSCGKIEGELGETKCKFCGNCLREYYATMERMKSDS